ncbi:cytochrome ubiquinol oxidase subunit I [Tessaracoccus sp. OS52]|uniref:cytochrome ubiquinol oxidase subunit I n=1 Tax=Tessaracoccus sp. OS52 TaxID=2886691 RepID=UPI001D12BAB6|nr:cytochrome ubiquinol oxidase subunit I [Tessaracoccus sp. OS52]MCC2594668.1 cytochrome ubiquinol oxidase subunit I [Tessaracoccus sp. OS52]
MDPVTLGRWQFGITTVYHYLFVPITIALSMIVAVIQTVWYRTGNDKYLRLTKFFGKLFLINFALGVVTGIVQEFQFGMNWSEYSRFVGDVFGAPLALEALLAFFLESTFLGLWIFGWDKLPKLVHLAAIYIVAFGTMLSAVFILAANSWMQNPVGTVFNNGRAELDGVEGFLEVLTNPVFLVTFPHVLFGAYMVGGAIVAAVSGWHLARLHKLGEAAPVEDVAAFRFGVKLGAWILIAASIFTVVTGDMQSKVMMQAQPMKMSAAEALYDTETNASFSVLTIGSLDGTKEIWSLKIPGLLSLMSGYETVEGINDLREDFEDGGFRRADGTQTTLQAAYADELAANYDVDPTPNIFLSYWTFRLMITLGMLGAAVGVFLLWSIRGGRLPKPGRVWTGLMVAMPLLPLFANSFGWIFTEMGRQPWIVAGVLPTSAGISPTASVAEVLTSMIVYTLLYGVLAVIEVGLFLKYTKLGLPDVHPVDLDAVDDPDAPLTFAY